MTETIDTFLTEANNMNRVKSKLYALNRTISRTKEAVDIYKDRMQTIAENQAKYIRAIDDGTVSHAVITFSPKKNEDANKVIPLSINDPATVEDFLKNQAVDWSVRLSKMHASLLEIEALTDEFQVVATAYADKIESLLK